MDRLTLAEALNARQNNFDLIRFVAATMVIVAHAYPLTYGHDDTELLHLLTQQQMTFGTLGVAVFFVISGFLIYQSYDNSPNVFIYAKARILRIFPAFIVVLFLMVFGLGVVLTELSFGEYFTQSTTYQYLLGVFLFPIYYELPGVFENNPWQAAVNGSLWTIPYEFVCYILVVVAGLTQILRWRIVLLILLVGVFLFRWLLFDGSPEVLGSLNHWIRGIGTAKLLELSSYFLAGMVLYAYREKIIIHHYLALISAVILVVTAIFGGLQAWFLLAGSYIIIYLAFSPSIRFHHFAKYGDFSYGIYIYAFPVQQTLVYYSQAQWHPLVNALFAIPITLFFAILSWHLIESKALKLKKVVLVSEKLKI
ncbi:acyltransferase [Candidatus Albibeggiatoa sp. nov. NOAA]|uniref:acyltransferase family protein n=1 Tax=Candidatus Albibeggiatoa sp. nov. NOAA TaxID=3162724 RepID=UPI0032FC4CE8|nr:acyltransferase [Thiotrichaceae bacterium]